MEGNRRKPLVTVIVVSYNSSRFILETLDSIKAQTYQNIELIVSDDCSNDNTVEICQNWIDRNGSRFCEAQVITTSRNTGTSGNANRGWRASKGEWIKYIAGDDLLSQNAISDYMDFVGEDKKLCFAYALHFIGEFKDQKNKIKEVPLMELVFGEKSTAKRQYRILKKQLIGNGPTCFMQKKLLEEIDGFDERFPLMDDYPMLLRVSKAGYCFFVLPKVTIYYRNHEDSVSHKSKEGALLEDNFVRCVTQYKFQYKREHLNLLWRVFLDYSLFISELIIKTGNSKRKPLSKFFYVVFLISDPFIWYSRGCNMLNKLLLFLKRRKL